MYTHIVDQDRLTGGGGIRLTRKGEAYAVRHSIRPHGCPIGIDPAKWRQAVAARIEELQDEQLALIEVLDMMDGDPDLEPSLGSPEIPPSRCVRGIAYEWVEEPGSQEHWANGCDQGVEADYFSWIGVSKCADDEVEDGL